MRNRLRLQNLPKYSDRLKLDKDLLVLQRALRNEVPKWDQGGGGGGTPYNGLYGEAPPERGTFFRLQVYKRVGISQAEVYKRVGKSII